MRPTRISERFQTRVGLRPGRAAARNEMLLLPAEDRAAGGLGRRARARRRAALALFEDVSYWQGATWALDTVATIGSTPGPETIGGEITKVVLTIFGVGTMFFVLVTLTELFVAGDLSGLLDDAACRARSPSSRTTT